MKRLLFVFAVVFCVLPSAVVSGRQQEKVVFGPVKYDVKERYGRENLYRGAFKAEKGRAVIELGNGAQIHERSDLIELTVNGEKILRNNKYNYSLVICVLNVQKENTFELVLKDVKPGGLRRPPLPPRFVTVTVKPYAGKLPAGAYGVNDLQGMNQLAGFLQKISNPESARLAASAANLRNDISGRAEAMRKLSDRRDVSARPFMFAVFTDFSVSPEVRGEAAIGLGMQKDTSSIPALMSGVVDPDERVRLGSTRALSLFPEEETGEPLMKMLGQLDVMRMEAVIKAIVSGGWKPVGTLLSLAESRDVQISRTAVSLLGAAGDARANDLLLKLLQEPGPRDVNGIIAAVGETKDRRALEPLLRMASDPDERAGKEAELGEALAGIGDPKAAGVIADMINKTGSAQAVRRLRAAYRQLTGNEYR